MSKHKAQQKFTGQGFEQSSDAFGGELTSNPKVKRPLHSKLPIHLTLRASKSVLRTPKTFGLVQRLIEDVARKHGVKIYRMANVGNHLHLAIKLPHVYRWASFIRELTGRMALALRSFLGGAKLWMYRPHTRVIRGWRKAFAIVKEYIELNILEAYGIISRTQIKTLRDYRAIFMMAS